MGGLRRQDSTIRWHVPGLQEDTAVTLNKVYQNLTGSSMVDDYSRFREFIVV